MSFVGCMMTPAIKLLIIINVAVFLVQAFFDSAPEGQIGLMSGWLGFVPHSAILELQIWRFLTYMFLHGSFSHIGFNMFFLWMFGAQVERQWGKRNFLIYYFVCGLGGAILYGLFNLFGMDTYNPMIGASAAVMGVLLAYGLSFPNAVILFMFIIPMKAKYFVLLLALIDLLSIPGGSQIAHLAHLGGMLSGFIFLRLTIPSLGAGIGSPAGGFSGAWKRYQTKRKMRVVRPDEGTDRGNGRPKGSDGKTPDQKRIDIILDKISRDGLQSLTDEEQEILRRAGRK